MDERVFGLDQAAAKRRLCSAIGLGLRTGPFAVRIHTPLRDVSQSLLDLYADYPLTGDDEFIDFSVSVKRPAGWRRWLTPQSVFEIDGDAPFNPLPGNQGFPLFEWGLNWCVYGMCHQYLTVHAAVLERNGLAVVLPAPSGSGKSTLCAGLLFSGWRLLSDELTLIDPLDGHVVPLPRPVSLKNQSIDVIRGFAPEVRFGSEVQETSKGVVAHFKAPTDAVLRAAERARPRWLVVPKFTSGAPARLSPIERSRGFMHMIENAFNYDVFGESGFRLLGDVIGQCDCYHFEYSNLADAVLAFDRLATGAQQRP